MTNARQNTVHFAFLEVCIHISKEEKPIINLAVVSKNRPSLMLGGGESSSDESR